MHITALTLACSHACSLLAATRTLSMMRVAPCQSVLCPSKWLRCLPPSRVTLPWVHTLRFLDQSPSHTGRQRAGGLPTRQGWPLHVPRRHALIMLLILSHDLATVRLEDHATPAAAMGTYLGIFSAQSEFRMGQKIAQGSSPTRFDVGCATCAPPRPVCSQRSSRATEQAVAKLRFRRHVLFTTLRAEV